MLLALLFFFNAFSARAEGVLEKVNISLCATERPKECLSVKAESAQQSSLQQLFYMKSPVVQKQNDPEVKTYDSGYLDIENSRLVLRAKTSEKLTEEVLIDINTLKVQTFVMK